MKREIDQNRIALDRLNSTLDLKAEGEKALNSKLQAVKSERDDYYNRYRAMEREINKIRNEFDSLSNWKRVYEDQNDQLQSELAKLRNQLAQSELKIEGYVREKSSTDKNLKVV